MPLQKDKGRSILAKMLAGFAQGAGQQLLFQQLLGEEDRDLGEGPVIPAPPSSPDLWFPREGEAMTELGSQPPWTMGPSLDETEEIPWAGAKNRIRGVDAVFQDVQPTGSALGAARAAENVRMGVPPGPLTGGGGEPLQLGPGIDLSTVDLSNLDPAQLRAMDPAQLQALLDEAERREFSRPLRR